jgi:hypothetical protein
MADLDPINFPSPAPVPESGLDEPASKQKASFQIDNRDKTKGERRQNAERRQSIRFEEDRRGNTDRRPQKSCWGLGTDL